MSLQEYLWTTVAWIRRWLPRAREARLILPVHAPARLDAVTSGELAGRTDSCPRAASIPRPPAPPPRPMPLPPFPLPQPVEPPPPLAAPTPLLEARRHRRARAALERARRKHDKWVQPQGPEPTHYTHEHDEDDHPAEPPVTKHEEPLPEGPIYDDLNDRIIVGEWLEGDGEEVLYEQFEFWGEFNFRDTILEQLDRYWVYLARMRKHDPDAYGFYKQMGATLLPYARTDTIADKPHHLEKVKDIKEYKRGIVLTPYFKQTWPAFGCCAFGTNPRDEKAETIQIDGGYIGRPKFLYFRKIEKFPWDVQPVHGGKKYVLTVWWDRIVGVRGHRYKWGRPMEFAVHISDDGERIRILKTRKDRQWWDWQIPYEYKRWAKAHGLDAQTHLSHLFCQAVKDIEYAQLSMLRIEVSKGDLTAVFGLNHKRIAYFFQDRDIVLNDAGRKKRIFHMVRPHMRKDGTQVPTQFRGMREFTWAGYKVYISVPGRDHFVPLEFNVPALWNIGRKRKGTISEAELGKELREKMHRGLK